MGGIALMAVASLKLISIKKLGYLATVCRVTKPEAGVKRKQN